MTKATGKARPKARSKAPRGPTLRQRVALCAADRMTPEVIAAVLGIPLERLMAEYAVELKHGGAIVRASYLVALAAAAKAGSSPAAKALLAIAGRPEPTKQPEPERPSDLSARALRILEGGKK